jgi:hypothetical protein
MPNPRFNKFRQDYPSTFETMQAALHNLVGKYMNARQITNIDLAPNGTGSVVFILAGQNITQPFRLLSKSTVSFRGHRANFINPVRFN